MAGLKITNETVFVIYRNGQPYESRGRKLAYTTKGAARGVITADARIIARDRFAAEDAGNNYWYDLTKEERDELVDIVRGEFEVVDYGPKRDARRMIENNDLEAHFFRKGDGNIAEKRAKNDSIQAN